MARRFDIRDFNTVAEEICDLWSTRKQKRKWREKHWAEVDRQISMEPDRSHKMFVLPDGSPSDRINPRNAWMPETELPLQSQALEISTADSRRLLRGDPWFEAHAELTDEYLEKAEGLAQTETGELVETGTPPAVRIAGDNDPVSLVAQEQANKIVAGVINHNHRQYDFWAHLDLINAEAFKYGMGVGRARMVKKPVFIHTARGVEKETVLSPRLVPRSIKNTYLDDSEAALMNEGHVLGPGQINESKRRLEDVQVAANLGSSDPNKDDGGWMPQALKGLEGDENGFLTVLEFEGDLVISRKTVRSVVIPGAIVTVAMGTSKRVIRFRFRQMPFSSYLLFPYNPEDLDTPYASSILMKGMFIQKSAVFSLNHSMMAAQLRTLPPVGWDRSDVALAEQGGPVIEPAALWETIEGVNVHEFGDPGAMFQMYLGFLKQYEDLTGVTAPRLGAQTVSHTTAFAKEAEINRGTIRVVDYVDSTLQGALTKWLYMEYVLTRDSWKEQSVFLDAYQSFVTLKKAGLPERAIFKAFGAGGPAEIAQKQQQKQAAAQQAIQMDLLLIQQGQQGNLDIAKMQEQVLREGGWTDVDVFKRSDVPPEGAGARPEVENGAGGDPGAAALSLQAFGQESVG